MREGDIYSWRWADSDKHADSAAFRNYRCKSCIAEYDGKSLTDTFWTSRTDGSWLNPDDVALTLLGNKNDMTVLADRPEFYRREDLVSMKHSNNSGAPIYLKAGAKRNADVMRGLLHRKQEEKRYAIRSATQDLERLALAERDVENGLIDKLCF
jgi:hypothetical protein